MNKLLLAIGGLLVGLLTLLFVAPAVVDWNRYRGVLEEETSRDRPPAQEPHLTRTHA